MANTDNVISAVQKYYHDGSEYLIPVGLDDDEVIAVSNFIEAQGLGFMLYDSNDLSKFAPLSYNNRVAGFSVPTDDTHQNIASAATVGRVGGLTVGSFDFANKTGLVGILAQDQLNFQQNQLEPYTQANVNTYYYAQGTPILRDGKTLSGNYIDTFVGLDWVIRHSNTALTDVMIKNNKLPFNATGINVLEAALNSVFSTAWGNGIVADKDDGTMDATVTALPVDELKNADVSARKYKGLSWSYKPANSIDDAYITGQITL